MTQSNSEDYIQEKKDYKKFALGFIACAIFFLASFVILLYYHFSS